MSPRSGLLAENAAFALGDFRLSASLAVPPGAICAVIGPSGSGKSTLLNGIAGFAPRLSGRLEIDGREIGALAPAERPVTLLFQEHNLFPTLSALENVGLGVRPSLRLSPDERDRARAALRDVGLEGLEARRPSELSGGQRQRVALARALLRERAVLLLDEPFAALGPAQRAEMLDLVAGLVRPRGVATLMVTHDPADARQAADLLAFCDAGRIEGARPMPQALAEPSAALAAYLGDRR